MRTKLFLLVTFLTTFLSCNTGSDGKIVDDLTPTQAFYRASVNTYYNPKNKIRYNSDLLTDGEMNYVIRHYLTGMIGQMEGDIQSVSIYYKNADPSMERTISPADVLGLSVYIVNSKKEMQHHFYLKEGDRFEHKVSYFEDMPGIINMNFMVYRFLPDYYNISTVGINMITRQSLDSRTLSDRNEMYLIRASYKHILHMSATSRRPYGFTEGEDCSNCEGGNGVCSSDGLYCNVGGEEPPCEDEEDHDLSIEKRELTEEAAHNIFNLELHTSFRDNFLSTRGRGKKIIEYYYGISNFVQPSDISINTLRKMITTLPAVNTAIKKLLTPELYNDDIIIDEDLKNSCLSILKDYRAISDDKDYQLVLADLEKEFTSMCNKTKAQINSEFQ